MSSGAAKTGGGGKKGPAGAAGGGGAAGAGAAPPGWGTRSFGGLLGNASMNAASLLATLGVSRQPAGAAAGGPGPGPAARKMATTGGDSRLAFAVCATQGWRKAMEDYATATLNLPLPPPLAADPARRVDYFAVFDGHGGAHVARFASRFLHKHIVGHDAFAAGDVTNAIRWGFFNTDNAARLDDLAGSETCGSTACVALVTADARLWVGNAGDCRAVLATRGRPARALSRDHKPDVPQESARIRRAGGDVFENRVMGELAVSRSLGDFRFKKNPKLGLDEQLVSSEPEVTVTQLSADDEFLFLACDGIWDVVGNQEVVDFVRQRLSAGLGAGEICEQLVERCLPAAPTEDARGMDNMTVVLVLFKSSHLFPGYLTKALDRSSSLDPDKSHAVYNGILPSRTSPVLTPALGNATAPNPSSLNRPSAAATYPSGLPPPSAPTGASIARSPSEKLAEPRTAPVPNGVPDPAHVHRTRDQKRLMAISLPAGLAAVPTVPADEEDEGWAPAPMPGGGVDMNMTLVSPPPFLQQGSPASFGYDPRGYDMGMTLVTPGILPGMVARPMDEEEGYDVSSAQQAGYDASVAMPVPVRGASPGYDFAGLARPAFAVEQAEEAPSPQPAPVQAAILPRSSSLGLALGSSAAQGVQVQRSPSFGAAPGTPMTPGSDLARAAAIAAAAAAVQGDANAGVPQRSPAANAQGVQRSPSFGAAGERGGSPSPRASPAAHAYGTYVPSPLSAPYLTASPAEPDGAPLPAGIQGRKNSADLMAALLAPSPAALRTRGGLPSQSLPADGSRSADFSIGSSVASAPSEDLGVPVALTVSEGMPLPSGRAPLALGELPPRAVSATLASHPSPASGSPSTPGRVFSGREHVAGLLQNLSLSSLPAAVGAQQRSDSAAYGSPGAGMLPVDAGSSRSGDSFLQPNRSATPQTGSNPSLTPGALLTPGAPATTPGGSLAPMTAQAASLSRLFNVMAKASVGSASPSSQGPGGEVDYFTYQPHKKGGQGAGQGQGQ